MGIICLCWIGGVGIPPLHADLSALFAEGCCTPPPQCKLKAPRDSQASDANPGPAGNSVFRLRVQLLMLWGRKAQASC